MDKIKRKGWVVFLTFFTLIVLGLGIWQLTEVRSTYKGKIICETQEEYANFKRELGRMDVNVKELDLIASEPPIVAEFEVTLPKEGEFPYGNLVTPRVNGISIPMVLMSLALIYLTVLVAFGEE